MGLEAYVPVPVRVAQFKAKHNGEGSIVTESFINYEKECATFKATLSVDGKIIATGHSLVADISDDKAFEKGETTAVGRALTFAGYEAESLGDEEPEPEKKASKKKSGGLGSKKAAPKKKAAEKEEEAEEEESEEEVEETPKKKSKGLPSMGKSSKKKAKAAEESEEEESEEEEAEEETEEEEKPKSKKASGGSSKLDSVMAKYGLK